MERERGRERERERGREGEKETVRGGERGRERESERETDGGREREREKSLQRNRQPWLLCIEDWPPGPLAPSSPRLCIGFPGIHCTEPCLARNPLATRTHTHTHTRVKGSGTSVVVWEKELVALGYNALL